MRNNVVSPHFLVIVRTSFPFLCVIASLQLPSLSRGADAVAFGEVAICVRETAWKCYLRVRARCTCAPDRNTSLPHTSPRHEQKPQLWNTFLISYQGYTTCWMISMVWSCVAVTSSGSCAVYGSPLNLGCTIQSGGNHDWDITLRNNDF